MSQLIPADQDERLNLLSSSIGRQNHLSIQIGSELDLHHDLLEDTDAAMDRTAARLGRARRRLDTVAHEAKQYGACAETANVSLIRRKHNHHRGAHLYPAHSHHRFQDVVSCVRVVPPPGEAVVKEHVTS